MTLRDLLIAERQAIATVDDIAAKAQAMHSLLMQAQDNVKLARAAVAEELQRMRDEVAAVDLAGVE